MSTHIPYIEVVGSAVYSEEIERYVSHLEVSARAAAGEIAVREVGELRNQVVNKLQESGLRPDELTEGGTSAWAPWYWKKKVGQEASHKIIVKCPDLGRMLQAFEALEPLFTNQRHTLAVDMQASEFKKDATIIEDTRMRALLNARKKAESIAAVTGTALDEVLEVEEFSPHTRRTNMYGDESWRGDLVAVAAAPAAGGSIRPELRRAERETTVAFRVRYGILRKG
jgi:uncharacterized protein YggE